MAQFGHCVIYTPTFKILEFCVEFRMLVMVKELLIRISVTRVSFTALRKVSEEALSVVWLRILTLLIWSTCSECLRLCH